MTNITIAFRDNWKIIRCKPDDDPIYDNCHVMTKQEIHNFRKSHHGMLEHKLHSLNGPLFLKTSPTNPDDIAYLEDCFNGTYSTAPIRITGIIDAKMEFHANGYVSIQVTWNKQPSQDEVNLTRYNISHNILHEGSDWGCETWDDNPVELFTVNGLTYWLFP